MKKIVILRRSSQIIFTSLFIYALWSNTYPLKGFMPPEAFFGWDPLIVFFTSLSERVLLRGIIVSLGLLALTLILGRYFCGWICPLGATIDLVANLKKKKKILSEVVNKRTRTIKFIILGIIAALAAFGLQAAWVFDPLVIMARFISLNFIPTTTLLFNKFFQLMIQRFELYGSFYNFYLGLKNSILGINIYYFASSLPILVFFLIVIIAALIFPRAWCRFVCPLGAIYCLGAKPSLLKRRVDECINCGKCRNNCRMGAIREDISTVEGECILCLDCVYDCPTKGTRFSFQKEVDPPLKNSKGITRLEFLFMIASSFLLLGFKRKGNIGGERKVIRPPGALDEKKFVDRCIRCGNCMKVCVTNGLQPVTFQSGLGGVWTPQLVPEIGYCEYNCTLCGQVCPTGAIKELPLAEKKKFKLGVAKIDKNICIPWAENDNCIVCEEHCPVAEKAIKLEEVISGGKKIKRPRVDENLCIGCGICQNKCPARPTRAIQVHPEKKEKI